MEATIVKITFSEFKKFLETAALHGRSTDDWTVVSENPGFNHHMGGGGDDTDELLSRINRYKVMEEGYYGDSGSDFVYILHPYDDFTGEWDKALDQLLPRDLQMEDASGTRRENLEKLVPEVQAAQLNDFTYNDGKSSDFLTFACDIVDIMDRRWLTLHAKRS